MSRLAAGHRLGIVTGIAAEARLAACLGGSVVCTAGRPVQAGRQAERLVEDGATLLVSFGIAGGLVPDAPPGTLIVPDAVVTDVARYPALADWAGPLGARTGLLYAGTTIVADSARKAELARRHKALAVDLESGETARVAHEAGIPFVALRAVADPAWRGLPPAALLPLGAKGEPNLGSVFASIAKRPGQIPGLIRTALDTRAALASLLRACRVLVV